ncbi:MAG: sporulation integral membrane protein YtvI [Oscillospiraceae bacterium]
MKDSQTRSFVSTLFWLLIAAAAGWLCLRYLLPWVAPLLLAFLLAVIIEPAVRFLETRVRLPRPLGAGICGLVLIGILIILLFQLCSGAISQMWSLFDQLPLLFRTIQLQFNTLEARIIAYLNATDSSLSAYFAASMGAVYDQLTTLPAKLSERLVAGLSSVAGKAPSILLFSVTSGIGMYFISAAYPSILRFFRLQIPETWRSRVSAVYKDLRHTVSRWLRAQLIMTAITFATLWLAFLLLHIEFAVLIALLIAVIDAFPILGSGIILLPWAIISALTGDYGLCVGLFATYGAVTLLHSCLQAKLVGDQLGLHPLVSLAAIYVGWCIAGVWGVLLAPIVAITIKQLNDRGIITLWKKEESI